MGFVLSIHECDPKQYLKVNVTPVVEHPIEYPDFEMTLHRPITIPK